MNPNKFSISCRYFLANEVCPFGEECCFSHEKFLCIYHFYGECRYGDRCRNAHTAKHKPTSSKELELLGKIELLNEVVEERTNSIEVQKEEISRLSTIIKELSNPHLQSTTQLEKRTVPKSNSNLVGLATSSVPLTNTTLIKEKKAWDDSDEASASESEDVALPKHPKNLTKSARPAAKSTPQELSQQSELEKTKICHAMWFTGRCNARETCTFEHIRRPRYEERRNPFSGKKRCEKEMQELSEKYDIPVDHRSPRKVIFNFTLLNLYIQKI